MMSSCGTLNAEGIVTVQTAHLLDRKRPAGKHRMFIRCEIVQEQLLTSELDGAVSARFRAVLNF